MLKVLKEIGAVDVLVVCARWFGGDMLGVSTISLSASRRSGRGDSAYVCGVVRGSRHGGRGLRGRRSSSRGEDGRSEWYRA